MKCIFISIPTNAHRGNIKLILKLLRRFGVLTPSSGSLWFLSAEVMNY